MEFYLTKVEEGQTVWDIAVQEYGDVTMAWVVLEDNVNALLDLNVDLVPGTSLNIRKTPKVNDTELMNHFRKQQIKVNCQS